MLNCQIAPNVAEALTKKTPIVALESTIITHGMPWPQNLDMANSVESCVRDMMLSTAAPAKSRFAMMPSPRSRFPIMYSPRQSLDRRLNVIANLSQALWMLNYG